MAEMSSPRVRVWGVGAKMTRRFAAVVVAGEGLAVFFGALVARTLAAAAGHRGAGAFLWFGVALALFSILTAGLMRAPYGIACGWLVQVATVLSGVIVPMMYLVGLVFLALWVTALWQGAKMDDLTAAYAAAHPVGDPPAAP